MKKGNDSLNDERAGAALQLFDCNCMVGRRADRREGEPWSLDQLKEDMAYYRISKALVFHAMSRDYDPVTGNREIVDLLGGSDELLPVWCVLPPGSGEMPESETFVRDMLDNDVKAVISFPRLHTYSLASWSMGKLLSVLERHRIPMLLPFQQFDWNEVYTLCYEHPYLPVIATGINYRQLRYLLPLWQTNRNLYVDSSWFSAADLIPFLKDKGYIGQLLFGTNYPAYTPAAAVSMITYADVGMDIKNLVGGGNLRELIRNIRME